MYPFRNLFRRGLWILDPFVIEVRTAEVRLNCIALNEDNPFHVGRILQRDKLRSIVTVTIRRADSREADQLTAIAHAAKRHWGYPDDWIEQWKSALTITPQFIADNEVFVAIVNDAIGGCCALVVTDSLAEIEHMW